MDPNQVREALDIFGRLLMTVRDDAIRQWDQTLAGKGRYPPWERIRESGSAPSPDQLAILGKALPHIVDTVIYCLLAELCAHESVDIRVRTAAGAVIDELWRRSDGFPAEPCGPNGWLERFSQERFEQPI